MNLPPAAAASDVARNIASRDAVDAHDEPRALCVAPVDALTAARHDIAWADLCRRALEPNVFLDPGFAIPLMEHAPEASYVFLQVWEEDGAASFGRLMGLFPITRGSSIWGSTHGFAHPQIACGTPLVDAGRADEVVDQAMTWLGRRRSGRRALALQAIPQSGAFRTVLERVCAKTGRIVVELAIYERAALQRPTSGREPEPPFHSNKRRKEYARQVRRLSDLGARSFTSARTPPEVDAALERFLALEAAGWKGDRGTAFTGDPALAAFVRSMVRRMAAAGRCRIDAIELDGRPLAMGILLRAGDRDFFWKTAFDEQHAALSPGVQLAVELRAAQLADPVVQMTDSCAVADHPMIDRLWSDRLAMSDLMICLRPDDRRGFGRALRLERLRRSARRRAKALWLRLRRRTR